MSERGAGSRRRIMVVNDEVMMVAKIKDFLMDDSVEIVSARALGQALQTLGTPNEPDLILLDLHLPVMDGIKALRYLRLTYPYIPIITLTDEGLRDLGLLSIQAGAHAFLSKPLDGTRLQELVSAQLPTN